jgi:iron(III) transport system ATP-binding protein
MSHPVRVEARAISLAFGDTRVLRDIDVVIEPGEFFALLGPSGCGKSTLLRLIAGFNQAQRGQLLIDGEEVSQVPPWKRNVGMVFQSYALWPHMTVAQNVAFGLEERKLPRPEVEARVRQALELVGLEALAARRPGQLSGGQQQRVALARTLAIEPRVLLLDEPLSNLDAKLRVHMRRELLAMQRKLGITTIFVTHDQEEAMTTADRIAVMNEGVIQQVGSPVELYDRPVNRFVAEFVGTINLLPATLSGESLECSLGRIGRAALGQAVLGEGEVLMALRPHSLQILEADNPRRGDRQDLLWHDGQVIEREFLGEFIRYRVRAGSAELTLDESHRAGDAGHRLGSEVVVGLDPRAVGILRE